MSGNYYKKGDPKLTWAMLHEKMENRCDCVLNNGDEYKVYIIRDNEKYERAKRILPDDNYYAAYTIFIEINSDKNQSDTITKIYNNVMATIEYNADGDPIVFNNVYLIDTAYENEFTEDGSKLFLNLLFHTDTGYYAYLSEEIINDYMSNRINVCVNSSNIAEIAERYSEDEGLKFHQTIFTLCCRLISTHVSNIIYMQGFSM
jgi:hypothetical protein